MAPSKSRATKGSRRRALRRTDQDFVQAPALCNFGSSPPMPLGMAAAGMYAGGRGATGSIITKKELQVKVVDFFDYNVNDPNTGVQMQVNNYWWEINQSLFNNAGSLVTDGSDQTFCRVRKLEVYVLPKKGFNLTGEADPPNNTNALGMFTVNVQVPSQAQDAPTSGPEALATNTQVTNILPQIDTFWKKVLTCDLQKTFQSGVVRPFLRNHDSGKKCAQCLFSMSITDPTSGGPYLPGSQVDDPEFGIRVKVVLHIDQPISVAQTAKLSVFRNEDFSKPATNVLGSAWEAPFESYVQMAVVGAKDHMR